MLSEVLDRGRESFRRQLWGNAFAELSGADREAPLEPEDLERLATAAYLIGRDEESAEVWARAYHKLVARGDAEQAARCAFWLAFGLLNRGEMARGSGWLARAKRLLDDGQRDCAEQGYLLMPVALQCFYQGDVGTAHATFGKIVEIASRFRDPDLATFGLHGQGRALIRLGQIAEGVALLDEAMVAVTAGEVSPIVVGTVYCSVIEACQEMFDLRRAREWTTALSGWCESQPDLVPYRGQCLVHRSEIMQLRGAWREAMAEAQRARERLSEPAGQPAVGAAYYQLAELHRLRGEFARAEEAYRQATQWGRIPQPGLALLRLAQGRVDAAAAAIRGVLDEAQDRVIRSRLLAANAEIMLASEDAQAARLASDELSEIAAVLGAPFLHAVSAQAAGAVLLAEGNPRAALVTLRRASTAWQELEAPYEAARARVLIGLACHELGDEDTAELELGAARHTFQQLGASPELARLEALSRKTAVSPTGGLTPREVEVLRLVAAGKSNREIAKDLVISEKTVDRHLSNMFTKLGVSSRAAATAHAYEHHLL